MYMCNEYLNIHTQTFPVVKFGVFVYKSMHIHTYACMYIYAYIHIHTYFAHAHTLTQIYALLANIRI